MSRAAARPLLIGEVFVDFTVTPPGSGNKLRLGGVVHAARGFWALGVAFDAAVVLPEYLEDATRRYLASLGCIEFRVLGTVRGAPNVTVIFDVAEVGDQGYETLLREEKEVLLVPTLPSLAFGGDALIFPGTYDLARVCRGLPEDARLHLDAAYDVSTPEVVAGLNRSIATVFLSTSSELFRAIDPKGPGDLVRAFAASGPERLILKENRGGARLIRPDPLEVAPLPAQLGATVNSVGVGDVFDAAYVALLHRGPEEASWRAAYASAAYAQTTCPDLFRAYTRRDLALSLAEMQDLGGTHLPWERRQDVQIYLAAPDFSKGERAAVDRALTSLAYHNFKVRRPVVENGELPDGAPPGALRQTYEADRSLLEACDLVFAIPTGRDPGTLVEVGLAIRAGIPVVTYDPSRANANTMVMAGSACYSTDLDQCLNAVFSLLAAEVSA